MLDYPKTPRQLVRPIDDQAPQHRAAEMLTAMEQGRSMAMPATMPLDAAAAERARAISKVGVGQADRPQPVSRGR